MSNFQKCLLLDGLVLFLLVATHANLATSVIAIVANIIGYIEGKVS
jgi:hypothetical protein